MRGAARAQPPARALAHLAGAGIRRHRVRAVRALAGRLGCGAEAARARRPVERRRLRDHRGASAGGIAVLFHGTRSACRQQRRAALTSLCRPRALVRIAAMSGTSATSATSATSGRQPSLSMETVVCATSNQVSARVDDELVVLDLDSSLYYALDSVGARIFE